MQRPSGGRDQLRLEVDAIGPWAGQRRQSGTRWHIQRIAPPSSWRPAKWSAPPSGKCHHSKARLRNFLVCLSDQATPQHPVAVLTLRSSGGPCDAPPARFRAFRFRHEPKRAEAAANRRPEPHPAGRGRGLICLPEHAWPQKCRKSRSLSTRPALEGLQLNLGPLQQIRESQREAHPVRQAPPLAKVTSPSCSPRSRGSQRSARGRDEISSRLPSGAGCFRYRSNPPRQGG